MVKDSVDDKTLEKIKDLQQALEVAKVAPGKLGPNKCADIDSTLSTRGLMQRKLYLMKMMLKNEKQANLLMKEKLDNLKYQRQACNY